MPRPLPRPRKPAIPKAYDEPIGPAEFIGPLPNPKFRPQYDEPIGPAEFIGPLPNPKFRPQYDEPIGPSEFIGPLPAPEVPGGTSTASTPAAKRSLLKKLGIGAGLLVGGYGAKSAYDFYTDNEVDDYRDAGLMALLNGEYAGAIDAGAMGGRLEDDTLQMAAALRHEPSPIRQPLPPRVSSGLTSLLNEGDIMRLAQMRQKQMQTREQILAELGVY